MAAAGDIPEQGRPPEPGAAYDANRNLKAEFITESLKKVFFAKRPAPKKSDESEIVTVSGAVDSGTRKSRHSFHQDVEEALSSLLWQPYEYQNPSKRSSLSPSSSSSCSSASSCDLGCGAELNGNAAPDLHLLVNNLRVKNRLSQSAGAFRSRDAAEQLLGRRDGHLLSRFESGVGCVSRDVRATMRVEIQNGNAAVVPDVGVPANGTVRSTSGVNLLHQTYVPNRTPLQVNNLSSVNVVGLPNHPRQASTPVTRNLLVPNHSRNISEPFNNSNQVLVPSHPRNGSEPAIGAPFRTNVPVLNQPPPRNARVPFQSTSCSSTSSNVAQRNGADARSSRVPLNVSNVNVNYYRAVPVNVVSAVPTIQCLNSGPNNVSNVNIVQAMPATNTLQINTNTTSTINSYPIINSNFQYPQNLVNHFPLTLNSTTTPTTTCTEVIVHSSHDPVQSNNSHPTRTFSSTEVQTDETATVPESATREQRRRERRERRHQRRINNTNHRHSNTTASNNSDQQQFINGGTQTDQLPDLLNNTLPPPYNPAALQQQVPPPVLPPPNLIVPGTLVQGLVPSSIVPSGLVPSATLVPFHPQVVPAGPGQVPLVQGAGPVPVPVPSPTGFRFPFPATGFRRSRYSEEPPKGCCGLLTWRPGSLRWFIALIALVAVCCVLVGTALGAMRPAGRDHLTVSLLMIGVGIILVTVSGVAWRLTSHDSSTCRSMLGLGSTESVEVCPRRFVPRLPPSYGRPHHPYAAMMYPEFQYRPPPPSYQASMQEYRLRLLLLDRGNTPQIQAGIQNAVSPPPTYRSHAGSLLRPPMTTRREAAQSEYSCPPSYRSQTSSSRPATIRQANSIIHSREHSLSMSESNHGDAVHVVNILAANEDDIALDNITLDSLKLEPAEEMNPLKMLLKGGGDGGDHLEAKDSNLVTIVQTGDHNPVIVTVSGRSHVDNGTSAVQISEIPSEMEILAHL